jgi:2-polyprenyl-3-methyl-5-hydroxy-6-metoxy-1,4-benzoquinol methylase/GNAT superfamily N-acetyltransferase
MEIVQYAWVPAGVAPDILLEECSALYSEHYGVWGEGAVSPAGDRIRLSAVRLRRWLAGGDASLALARWRGELVGYAIVVQASLKDFGVVSWVTQFVVHRDHRAHGIGTRLLFAAWGMSDHAAWGITTSNPYAVRALEKATRRRCSPGRISRNRRRLERLGTEKVPYLDRGSNFVVNDRESRVNTSFFVDRSRLSEKLRNVEHEGKPWLLGGLPSGWEWFAFCFRDQPQIRLTRPEIEAMLAASDEVTRAAYGRMKIGIHPWARHAAKEADWIREWCRMTGPESVLDLGCGTGRHGIALAQQGHDVLGIDYAEPLLHAARTAATGVAGATFRIADCRSLETGRTFDVVLCLYDVVGSHAQEGDNLRILETVRRHLKPDGRALLSVMNGTATITLGPQSFSLEADPDRLLALSASGTMQTSGNVFDPAHLLVETDTGVFYRKERFEADGQLPTELIVRDRRYSVSAIADLCRQAGLAVRWARPVRAGRWDEELPETDPRAKEILLLCEPMA